MEPIWAVGLMTGTVLDGNIDVAMLRTDGERVTTFGPWRLAPYPPGLRDLLAETLAAARAWQFDGPEPPLFAEAEAALTRAQAGAVRDLVESEGPGLGAIGIVGFHGQTVLHRGPAPGRAGATRQLGDGQLMADMLGVPVAFDFRSADVAAGGQGAPLSAIYHAALLRGLGTTGETAVLNLGGVANVTWWDGADQVIAFDTGPANAPINDFVRDLGLGDMDRGGALALRGRVDEARLARLLDHPYLARAYPKSLDRFDFTAAMAEGCGAEDGAALLTAFTAGAVGRGLDLLPRRPSRLVVCGGGRHNPAIMAALRSRAAVDPVPAEAVGWRGDAIEAECFALLAVRVLRGLPISFPTTTGAPRPMTGGRIAHPRATTETAAPRFADMDSWPTGDIVDGLVEGQFAAIAAVQTAAPALSRAVEAAARRLGGTGRLIYLGAGTSGRIATQDAVELRPTFDWPESRAIALMAGGPAAFVAAQEGAEDRGDEAVSALDALLVGPTDVVIGVAASGRTPFAVEGLRHARTRGALTIGLFNNRDARLGTVCDIPVLLETGAEMLAGSTRLKAGTAQKAALNAFSTALMIRLGYVYRGLMVEMRPTNAKLRERAVGMVARLTASERPRAEAALDAAGGHIKTAVVMLARGMDRPEAESRLAAAGGRLGPALRDGA